VKVNVQFVPIRACFREAQAAEKVDAYIRLVWKIMEMIRKAMNESSGMLRWRLRMGSCTVV
jgi:hypothetical protein